MPCLPAISSHSLGRAWVHDLPAKLDQAARFGLDIELFFEDLDYLAQSLPGSSTSDKQFEAARIIRSMCDERGISIVCLQPFMHYEGLRNREYHNQRIEEMKIWIQLAKILRTDIIAIPSTFLPETEISGDISLIVRDMREVADLAAPHGIQISYEALAWGTYVNTWEQAYDVVKKVDRWNFGICLDTFNIAAKVVADPTTATRKTADADDALKGSLQRLRNIDVAKILYVQVVDAEYLQEPISERHELYQRSQHPRMSWSRNCRLFYGETELGAYLPVKEILQTILDIGFDGYLSAELFNASLTKPNRTVPEDHVERAAKSFEKISRDLRLEMRSHKQRRPSTRRTTEPSSRAQL